MNAVGIICEYNPFHLGHARMLEGLRRQYDAPLVCAMSGNFVQRGDAAVARKHARGEMAVRCGADLVLELPTPWAMASAERFADGGVALLSSTGVVSHLAFGSECGDLTALQAAEAALSQPELMPRIRQLLAQGMAYAPARQQAAEELGAPPQMLSRPNDILAIEYLKALRRQKAPMEPLAVLRQGAGHDGAPSGDTASASYLRTLLRSGRTDEALSYLPAPAAQVLRRELALGQAPADLSHCRRAILARLRQLREEDFLPYDGGKEGLYHRFYQAVRTSCSPEELLETAKTKRYPTSRLRRMLLSAWLDVTPPAGGIPYLRVLAANERGRDLLRQMQRRGVPVLTRPGDVSRLGPAAEALFRREALWTDLYVLTYPQASRSVCGSDWRTNPILL